MARTYNATEEGHIQKLAEEFQQECHEMVELIKKSTENGVTKHNGISYQNATNVWIFKKLAEMQHQIDQLKKAQRGKGVKGEN